MNRIRIRLISIKVFLTFMIGIVPFCATAQDVDGSEDHPLITRYEGSNIIYYHQASYDEYFIPLGRINVSNFALRDFSYDDGMHLEGKVTRIQYDAPEGRSTLEIFRNYESALQRAGFDILYAASGADLGDRRFGVLTYPRDVFTAGITNRQHRALLPNYLQSEERDQRYLAAKFERPEGDVYVALFLSQSYAKETAAIQLDVIETVPMEADMVTATSLFDEMERTGRARVYDILFEVGSYEILPESDGILSEIALLLNEHPEISLYITGHTDDTGDFDYNMELSQQRANAVMQWLVETNEINENRLHAIGVGPVSPISTNETDEGRALNRRVELVRKLQASGTQSNVRPPERIPGFDTDRTEYGATDLHELYEMAFQMYDDGFYENADKEIQKLLDHPMIEGEQFQSIHGAAWHKMAKLSLLSGDLRQARECYERAIRTDSMNVDHYNEFARLAITYGAYSSAGDIIDNAIEKDIYNNDTVMMLAHFLNFMDDHEGSEEVRNYWLSVTGDDLSGRSEIAEYYLKIGMTNYARYIFETIISIDEDWDGIELLEGRIHAAEGNWEDAIDKLQNVVENHPDDPVARSDLITCLLRTGEPEAAVEIIQEGLNRDPNNSEFLFLKGRSYEVLGDADRAIDFYKQTIEINPAHIHALMNLGILMADRQEEDATIRYFDWALRSDPMNIDMQYNLGYALTVSQSDYQRGIRLLGLAAGGNCESAKRAEDFIDEMYEGVKQME